MKKLKKYNKLKYKDDKSKYETVTKGANQVKKGFKNPFQMRKNIKDGMIGEAQKKGWGFQGGCRMSFYTKPVPRSTAARKQSLMQHGRWWPRNARALMAAALVMHANG
jgi:hypothetical protein